MQEGRLPRTADLFKDRGDAYFNSAHYPEALTDYDSALALEPDIASRYVDRAQLERYLGQFPQVVTDYTKAIRLEPNRAVRYIARAHAYQQQGDWADAMADFNTAVQVEADRGFPWDDPGGCMGIPGRLCPGARGPRGVDPGRAQRRGLAGGPRLDSALHGADRRRLDGVRRRDRDVDSLAAERYRSRASALLYLGRYDQATADFDKATALEPGAGGSYEERSVVALYRRQPLVGLVDLGRAEALDKNYEASAGRARLELAAGQLDDAIRDYTAYIARRRPNNPVGFEGRGLALMVKGDFSHAVEDLRRSRDYGAFSADRELWIHFCATRGGQNPQVETARRATFYDPKHWPAALFDLALGKRTVASMIAAAHDTSALMMRDRLSEAYTFAGEYYLALKRPTDAVLMFQKAEAQGYADSFVDIVASAELHALRKQ